MTLQRRSCFIAQTESAQQTATKYAYAYMAGCKMKRNARLASGPASTASCVMAFPGKIKCALRV